MTGTPPHIEPAGTGARTAAPCRTAALRGATRERTARLVATAIGAAALVAPAALQAQGVLTLNASTGPTGTTYSVPVQTMLIFSALSFLPAVLLLMTSFTRIVIVLSLVRQALGLQASPPNQVIVGMALFLTFFVMGPTLDRIHEDAYKPYSEQRIGFEQAIENGSRPLRAFMQKQTRESDVALFSRIARVEPPDSAEEVPMRVLIPAFVISELKTAFQIGFMVFVPFLLIDLIVASVLMSMGMMMLSPVLVALPFKLILFVLADGW
ncbi:MAG: flagellar type III secretion system pore protein FliP, partial [Burkholderiaceae bacterium]|nr:flagellar type III secretion system pore protein FliP [Burkholderiaceae bacterium]